MSISAVRVELADIAQWRDMYRLEMACQVVHDSIHYRRGWTDEYLLTLGDTPVGYGSVAIGGPWTGKPTAYEFYVVPYRRTRIFELFQAFLDVSGSVALEVQSNDVLATTMLHAFGGPVTSEAILFHDRITTSHHPMGACFRTPVANEIADITDDQRRWHGVIEVDGAVAATGGILFHYNRPYGDIYMDTKEAYRRRGFGAFIVQELKRVAYEGGHVPAARCSPHNVASRRTLQSAGFIPCAHILTAPLHRGSE